MTTTTASPASRFTGDLRADVLVAIVIAAALIGGYVYQFSLRGQTTRVADPNSNFSLSIPGNWTAAEEIPLDTFVVAYDTRADSIYKSTIAGQSFALDSDNPTQLDQIVDRLIQRHGEELLVYHLIEDQPTTVAGAEARAIQYAYVTQPIDDPFMASPPVVVIATDYVIYTDTEYWLITLAADEKIAEQAQADFDSIIQSITLP